MWKSTPILLTLAVGTGYSLSVTENSRKLKQTHVVFRHGARTPVFWNGALEGLDTNAFAGKCGKVRSKRVCVLMDSYIRSLIWDGFLAEFKGFRSMGNAIVSNV